MAIGFQLLKNKSDPFLNKLERGENKMTEILAAASIITPLVVGVTGLIKTQMKDYKLLPVINVIAGILLGVLYAMTLAPQDLAIYAWAGAVSGLAAGGLFDLGNSMVKPDVDPPDYGDGQEGTENLIYKEQDQSKG